MKKYGKVVDNKIVYMPRSGINPQGQYISNMHLLPEDIILSYGWKDVEDLELEPIEASKEQRIMQASYECNKRCLGGFTSLCLGEPKMFDSAETDQMSIQGLALTAIMGLQGLTIEETHWKGTGELECYKFEYAQTLKLAEDLKKHIELNVNQFNAERLEILND